MSGFDFRFLIPIFINLLKTQSEEALPWDWDAFNVLNPSQTSWTKICFHVFLFLLLSSTSMTFTLIRPPPSNNNTARIRFQPGNFSPHLAVSHVSSVFFPQILFWFFYPAILILSGFLGWINVKLSALPVWNLHITSTLTRQQEEANISMEAELPVPQAVVHISPEDGDSLGEA